MDGKMDSTAKEWQTVVKGLEKNVNRIENYIKWIAKDAIRNKDIPS